MTFLLRDQQLYEQLYHITLVAKINGCNDLRVTLEVPVRRRPGKSYCASGWKRMRDVPVQKRLLTLTSGPGGRPAMRERASR